MHPEAREFVHRQVSRLAAIEIGSLNVNGSIRDLFPHYDYLGLDLVAGPGVDVVADGATFDTPKRFDVAISCEAFEHAANWREVVKNISRLLRPNGIFIGTAAGPGREPHNCDGTPHSGVEHYENVCPLALATCLEENGFREVLVEHRGKDVRWSARR